MSPPRACVLTVSDTCNENPSADRSGPVAKEMLESGSQFVIKEDGIAIVPDNMEKIQSRVLEWCSSPNPPQFICTSGGTGFSLRDITPEAIQALITKPCPGLVHAMIAASLKATPLAALARPIAGIHVSSKRDSTPVGTLIVCLPGSPKAVKENLAAIMPILPHAIELLSGGTGQQVHAALAKEKSHEHGHHQHHNHHHHHHGHHAPTPRTVLSHDPSQSASRRHRSSPYPIISIAEAMELIFANTPVLPPYEATVEPKVYGHVLSEDVFSERDIPGTNTTNVDGYAVHASDGPGDYPVLTGATYPQPLSHNSLPEKTIYRINTGGPLPPGADAIVMVEDTEIVETIKGSDEEKTIKIRCQVDVGENIRKPGSDVKVGEKILERGTPITNVGGELGSLVFVGKSKATVYRKPVVAVLSTGNEILDISQGSLSSDSAGIFDSNRPSLLQILETLGFETVDLGIVRDTIEDHELALRRGMETADVIVTTGGTSMGESDLLKPCIERNLDGTIHFGRVATKPGKPTTFATVPVNIPSPTQRCVFALPGNPASALVTFYVFVLPCLRKMSGFNKSSWNLPTVKVKLTSMFSLDPRPEFHRVLIKSTETGLVAYSTGGQRSSRTISLAGANGLVALPVQTPERTTIAEGEMADAVLIGPLV